jgi:hypothetical protein
LLSIFQKNLDFIYSLCDCASGTVSQPCDIGLPVSVHNKQGQQFQIVLRQFAKPPVQHLILQRGQPAKPLGVHIAGVPGTGQGFKFSEQAGLLVLVLTLFAGKGLSAVSFFSSAGQIFIILVCVYHKLQILYKCPRRF